MTRANSERKGPILVPVVTSANATTAEALERVLEQIDAGQLEATTAQRAYIAGALDALRSMTEQQEQHPQHRTRQHD
ncbi:hypothetical protein [Arthrobacter roseus]|uniref:hypothetical protein n=1 Tax=Arthrobacter roseus TaxID=136274 RepID=UPI00196403BE|nr:hypothetical protein [Arthrobacter roseus]MBM7848802.1 hypothetical protein [Arthrobacter roseus]